MINKFQEDLLNHIEDLATAKLDQMDTLTGSKKYACFFEYEVIREVYESIYLHLLKKGGSTK